MKKMVLVLDKESSKNNFRISQMICMIRLFGVGGGNRDTQFTSWWRHQMETFSALLALCAGNSPVPVNSPHKGQWRGALMFSLICVWINGWVNNRGAGDLRRHRGHYDVMVMFHGKCMVHFSFSCHNMANFTIYYNTFPGRGRDKEITKPSVNITTSRLKMALFTNPHAKRENFTVTTGIANHDFTSAFGRFHVFTHENILFHVSRKTYCPSIIT